MKKTLLVSMVLALALGSACADKKQVRAEDDPVMHTPPEEDDLPERMAKEHAGDKPIANGASSQAPAQPVTSQPVVYARVGGMPVQGYLSMPEGATPGSLPALIVIHEWWGLNDNVRAMTDRLAGEGYIALAVDLYNGQSTEDPALAKQLMQTSMSRAGALRENLNQALQWLEREAQPPATGVIGWCFGGGWSLQTALMAPDRVDAVVVYYGRVNQTQEQLAALDAPLLGIFGEEDEGIPAASVRAFEANLRALGKPADVYLYDGAGHAFANPSGTRYEPQAAEDAWQKTRAFLARHLK